MLASMRIWRQTPFSRFSRRLFSSVVSLESPPLHLLRNVAIIAHVDHGKTTTVDSLIRLSGASLQGSMDSNELEKERGITILSKSTRIRWGEHTLNLIDTPGHAEFAGEVERVMSMVDGVVLIVDMSEGVMTQTKYVLKKALSVPTIRPIVFVNKVDRVSEKTGAEIENEIFDLFCSLDAQDHQLEYPVLFGSAKFGWAVDAWAKVKQQSPGCGSMAPLLDTIVRHVQPPTVTGDTSSGCSMLVTTIEQQTSNFGLMVTGKIYTGRVSRGDSLFVKAASEAVSGTVGKIKVRELSMMAGMERVAVNSASAGDIVSVSLPKNSLVPNVTDTLCAEASATLIPSIPIDPPVLSILVTVNNSPLAGQDGKLVSLEAIKARLKKEATLNPAIQAEETPSKDAILLKGRGELQLGILVETMRREGFELSLSPPQILTKKNAATGALEEPYEEVTVVVPETMSGMVSEKMITRDADLVDMVSKPGNLCEIKFVIAAKNFLGMREVLRAATKSEATIMNGFKEYRATNGKGRPKVRPGVLVCFDNGLATKYDMEHLVEKGVLFIKERDRVYTGLVVGEHISDSDLDMSVAKGEDRGDVRRKHKEKKYSLPPAREMSIEAALAYIADDEMIEVTPARVAMRKVVLDPADRRRIQRKGANASAKTM